MTSSLHEQLASQPGIHMSNPKEPYFFSNDEIYALGTAWYEALFSTANATDICGESSTHYTKLPTYPKTVDRLLEHLPNAKFVYVMRHPIDRLISHYVHDWTECKIKVAPDEAVQKHTDLIDYGRYDMQLLPFLKTFGAARILPVFYDRLLANSQQELERICQFIGYDSKPFWSTNDNKKNESAERLRRSPIRDAIVDAPVLRWMRRTFIPRNTRNWVKCFWQMRKKPQIQRETIEELTHIFDESLATLGSWLGVELSCANFRQITSVQILNWSPIAEQLYDPNISDMEKKTCAKH